MNVERATTERLVEHKGVLPWGVDSEYGTLREALLCPADYFEWIPRSPSEKDRFDRAGGFDRDRANDQHLSLVETLRSAGVTCHFLEPDPVLPYQVFTRDSSSMTPWGAVIAQIALPSRRGEYAGVVDFYTRSGIPIWRMPTAGYIEGADVMVVYPGLILVGYSGSRTQEAAACQMARWIEEKGWQAQLIPYDEFFIHLDVLVCMASDRAAAVFVDGAPHILLELLDKRGIDILPVGYHDMINLGCNILSLGNNRVISTVGNEGLNSLLRKHNIEVFELDYSMFTTHSGGVHCSVMAIRRDPVG